MLMSHLCEATTINSEKTSNDRSTPVTRMYNQARTVHFLNVSIPFQEYGAPSLWKQ